MNSLRSLPNSDLLASAFRLAAEERRITLSVLEHFREIERRKAYSDLGYKSLFEYAVTHLHYSEGSASRRIAAMHALKEHPELAKKIQAGETTVTSVARIHTTIRRDEKISASKWKPEKKKEAFANLGALSIKELERKLVALAPEAALQERTRPITSELSEVKIHLTLEDLVSLEELRGSLAHSLKNPASNSELFRKLIQIGKERLEKSRITSTHSRRIASPLKGQDGGGISKKVEAGVGILPPSSSVSAHNKRTLFNRANHRCEYLDSSGKRCGSGFFLQIEHRIPRARGGSNHVSNLEVLCRDHNLIRGLKVFGPEKMRRN